MWLVGVASVGVTTSSSAQSVRNVLVVVNTAVAESVEVGDHYVQARQVPPEQVVRIDVPRPVADPKAPPGTRLPNPEDISRADYVRRIEGPIAQWIAANSAHDRILFIVLTKGVPLRIAGTGGRQGTVASVDSELALLYTRQTGRAVAPGGPMANPYYLGDRELVDARPFTHASHDIYLVTRLDGFTVEDAKGLVDRAIEASQPRGPGAGSGEPGKIVIDLKAPIDARGNEWLQRAASRLTAAGLGDRVVLEKTSQITTGEQGVLGYASWASGDPSYRRRRSGLGFVPGAISTALVSTDGRTLREPPSTWKVGVWNDRASWFAGSPESLAGDLIRDGVTGLSAQVAEPYLDGAVRPDILLPAYLAGATLGEAYYLAMPYVGWQTIVIGDPLCRVATWKAAADTELDPGLDAETELPAFFSPRRLAGVREEAESALAKDLVTGAPTSSRPRVLEPGLRLVLKAEARLAKGDRDGARELLERAIEIEPRLNAAQLALASTYEASNEHDRAIERYRAMVANVPSDAVALNNLAYALAVRKNNYEEALPLARKAYTLSRGSPVIADTLAWVSFLSGDKTSARQHIVQALRGAPGNADIRYHAAAIAFDLGQLEVAKAELTRALELDPGIGGRDEVKDLRAKLGMEKP